MLALTFDDGPDPRGTPAVLDALEAAEAKATFFVLGRQVERHRALFDQVRAGGHTIEVHGFEHLRHPFTPRADVERDLERALEALAPVKPRRWRVPWGHLAPYTCALAQERGLQLVGWDADTHDWRGDPAAVMLETLPLRHGAIVLAHDGIGEGARRATAAETAALIAPLAHRARARGLTPGPLTDAWPVPVPLGNPAFG
ncbi:polysaccharide deacetylase family protein [Solirubrobacter soli]|uniref:polysaccharide deacetylase family protein n=1 Tax=Solirubrobacter soli TaxID=363832 RepID=UPI0003FACF99|nr:polysaccharide deacetylase family protein [Solirubrobacter soli]